MMPPETLAGYSREQLEKFYLSAEDSPAADEWRKILADEMDGRDERARASKPGARQASRDEWQLMAHAQYLAAERECAGVLLSKRGRAAGIDPVTLWQGPLHRAEIYASEELREFWRANGRISITEWQAQASGERRQWEDRKQAVAMEETAAQVVAGAESGYGTSPADALTRSQERLAEINRNQAARAERAAARQAHDALQGVVAVRPGSAVSVARLEVDGDQLLRYVYTYLKHFAHWGSEAELIAATLWVIQTHARNDKGYPVWDYCARLAVVGESGSGKSWKSRLIGKLAYHGEILVEPTAPAFIDLCAENHTVIMTEADEAFRSPGRSRKILAVANASYEPDRSSSRKQGGVAVRIPLFCQLVLDGIDDVLLSPNRPDLKAMMSRCVILFARKAPAGYRPPRFDTRARGTAELLSQRATAWMAQEVATGITEDMPQIPDHLGNRPYALWLPMFQVALRADKALRARVEAEGGEDPGWPWSDACTDACEQLEKALGVPDPTEDQASELDRQMAAYELGEDVFA